MVQTKEEKVAYKKKYHLDHRDEELIQQKEYYKVHREERLAYAKEYRDSHKEEIAVQRKKYCQLNKKKKLLYNREYCHDHREERDVYAKKYYQEHKYNERYIDICRRSTRKYRLKKRQLIQSYTPKEWKEKVDATNGICPQCDREYVDVWPFCVTLDHIPSISIAPVGFCYTINDVFPVCGPCNTKNHVHSNDNTKIENFGWI